MRGLVHRGYWIDIGTPEKYLQVHRDILQARFPVALDGDAARAAAGSTRRRGSTRGAELEGRSTSVPDAGSRPEPTSDPTPC